MNTPTVFDPDLLEKARNYGIEGDLEGLKALMDHYPISEHSHMYGCACIGACSKGKVEVLKLLSPVLSERNTMSNALSIGYQHQELVEYLLPLAKPDQIPKSLLAFTLASGNEDLFHSVLSYTGNTLSDVSHGQWVFKNNYQGKNQEKIIELFLSPWCDACQKIQCHVPGHSLRPMGFHENIQHQIFSWVIDHNRPHLLKLLLPSVAFENGSDTYNKRDYMMQAFSKNVELTEVVLSKCNLSCVNERIASLELEKSSLKTKSTEQALFHIMQAKSNLTQKELDQATVISNPSRTKGFRL